MKKFKGFTLVELMLVMAAFTAMIAITLPLIKNYKLSQRKEQLMNQHIDMYALLVNAVGSWANTTYAEIDDFTWGQVSIEDLKDGDYLPSDFAFQYSGSVAHDILGLELTNYWSKSEVEWNGQSSQVIRTITTVDEAASWNSQPEVFLAEKFANIESEDDCNTFVGGWYNSLAGLASSRGLVAGRLKANSRTVVGVNQAWKFVLDPNEFNIPTRPYQRIVFFWGWPDLNGFGGGVNPLGTEPPVNQANLYSGCYVTSRTYFQTVEQSSQCDNVSGFRSLIDLESFSPSTPSPIYTVPGVGSIFSYVNRQAITDLSSIASQCYQRGNAYCAARAGTNNPAYCGTSDENRRTALIQQCLSTPVFSVVNNVSFGGGIYKSNELYKDGSFEFGRVNGITYEVDIGSELQYSQQYTFCCPNDVPDLEEN